MILRIGKLDMPYPGFSIQAQLYLLQKDKTSEYHQALKSKSFIGVIMRESYLS